jgi:hypothetical protein
MIQIIRVDGTTNRIEDVAGEPTLEQLYAWIECDMIEVPGNGFTTDGKPIQFVVDEEGKINDRPVNPLATALYDDVLRRDPRGLVAGWDTLNGTVVILTGEHLLT